MRATTSTPQRRLAARPLTTSNARARPHLRLPRLPIPALHQSATNWANELVTCPSLSLIRAQTLRTQEDILERRVLQGKRSPDHDDKSHATGKRYSFLTVAGHGVQSKICPGGIGSFSAEFSSKLFLPRSLQVGSVNTAAKVSCTISFTGGKLCIAWSTLPLPYTVAVFLFFCCRNF